MLSNVSVNYLVYANGDPRINESSYQRLPCAEIYGIEFYDLIATTLE